MNYILKVLTKLFRAAKYFESDIKNKRSPPNFTSDIKPSKANYLIYIPSEIIKNQNVKKLINFFEFT